MTAAATVPEPAEDEGGPLAVFQNGGFLRLWLSQAATQIGGNMVLFGLTVIVFNSTNSNTAVSLLILTFLVPAVLFSAVAGVYVDRIDRRLILIATNILRGAGLRRALPRRGEPGAHPAAQRRRLDGHRLLRPGRAGDDPGPRAAQAAAGRERHLHADAQRRVRGRVRAARSAGRQGRRARGGHPRRRRPVLPRRRLLRHAARVATAAVDRRGARTAGSGSGRRSERSRSTFGQLREGFAFIRANRSIGWSLIYLGITASLVGVLGVLGPAFAKETLGLAAKDFAVVVLPLGFGIVTGILLLNSYGGYFPRRRVIEGGLIALGILLAALSAAGPISRLLQRADEPGGLDLSGVTSLLAVVVVIAFFAGIAYGLVAIPSQTQLQEDLPEDVRGRVFGVLGMLVSVASFLPIIVVGPISDLVGTTAVIFVMAIGVMITGFVSVVTRGQLRKRKHGGVDPGATDAFAIALESERASETVATDPLIPAKPPLEPVGVPGPSSPAHDAQAAPPLVPERTGPADPTDRD